MKASFRLGRIAGVPVGVNWSVLIIFALITWALSAVQFPAAYPGGLLWPRRRISRVGLPT